MPDLISNVIVDDAVAEALQLDLCFLSGAGQTRHVPFAFTPATITTPGGTAAGASVAIAGQVD